MLKELVSETQINEILGNEYGIHVIPKRKFVIPEVTPETLQGKVKTNREGPILRYTARLEEFLRMQAVDDIFGSNHAARVAAIAEIEKRFGGLTTSLLKAYECDNQFRLNKLSGVPMGIDRMIERLSKPELQLYFQQLAKKAFDTISGTQTGIHYVYRETVEEKLQIVHDVEDIALGALQALA